MIPYFKWPLQNIPILQKVFDRALAFHSLRILFLSRIYDDEAVTFTAVPLRSTNTSVRRRAPTFPRVFSTAHLRTLPTTCPTVIGRRCTLVSSLDLIPVLLTTLCLLATGQATSVAIIPVFNAGFSFFPASKCLVFNVGHCTGFLELDGLCYTM